MILSKFIRLNRFSRSEGGPYDLIWLVAGLMAFLAISLWGCSRPEEPPPSDSGKNPGISSKHGPTVIVRRSLTSTSIA